MLLLMKNLEWFWSFRNIQKFYTVCTVSELGHITHIENVLSLFFHIHLLCRNTNILPTAQALGDTLQARMAINDKADPDFWKKTSFNIVS